MHHARQLDQVRDTVRGSFVAQGVDSLDEFCETILIRDGYYCGRSFTCCGLRAVWFVEENVLKFYSRGNELVASQPAMSPEEAAKPMAA